MQAREAVYIEVYEYQLRKFPYLSSSELSSIPIGFFFTFFLYFIR